LLDKCRSRREFIVGATATLISNPLRRWTVGGVQAPTSGRPAAPDPFSDKYGIHFDSAGFITQRDDDGGDSAQREGMYWLAVRVRETILHDPWPHQRTLSFEQVMQALEVDRSGTFRRHPTHWNDPKDLSRDQTVPLVAAMGVNNDKERLERFYRELRRRNWFAQNGDLMGDPVNRNLVRRARDEEPSRLTDAPSLRLAAAARVLAAKSSLDDVGDDLNMIVTFLLAAVRKPNRESDSARTYYSKNRPDNYGMFLGTYRQVHGISLDGSVSVTTMRQRMDDGIKQGWKNDCPRILGALRWYFRAESGGNPGMATLYEPIINRWFQ
jgi:hypothetical protein